MKQIYKENADLYLIAQGYFYNCIYFEGKAEKLTRIYKNLEQVVEFHCSQTAQDCWVNLQSELNYQNHLIVNQVSKNFSHFFKMKNKHALNKNIDAFLPPSIVVPHQDSLKRQIVFNRSD